MRVKNLNRSSEKINHVGEKNNYHLYVGEKNNYHLSVGEKNNYHLSVGEKKYRLSVGEKNNYPLSVREKNHPTVAKIRNALLVGYLCRRSISEIMQGSTNISSVICEM